MMKRYSVSITVQLLLNKNNQFLLQRRYNTGYEDGKYSFVGGHKEKGEEILEAMMREVKEEIGIDISRQDLEVVEVLHRKTETGEYIDFVIKASHWEGIPQILEKDKSDELIWVDENNIPDNTISFVKDVLENYSSNRKDRYKAYGWKD